MRKVTKETTLAEVLERPGAEEALNKHQVPCLTCPFAKMEMDVFTLGQICQMYKINCEKLIKELNK